MGRPCAARQCAVRERFGRETPMYGLTLTYLVTLLATISSLRRPVAGLYAFVGFAVLRPQFIWGFAGDLSNLSYIIGLAMLIGWAVNGFGSWKMAAAKVGVLTFAGFLVWFLLASVLAEYPAASVVS